MNSFLQKIRTIPEGYCECLYNKNKYAVTKQTFNGGKSFKIYAEQLNGNDVISCNFYQTNTKNLLKPCEMSATKVVHFFENCKYI